MPNFDNCGLHIPHKNWAVDGNLTGGTQDRENHLAIERWADNLLKNCITDSVCVIGRWTFAENVPSTGGGTLAQVTLVDDHNFQNCNAHSDAGNAYVDLHGNYHVGFNAAFQSGAGGFVQGQLSNEVNLVKAQARNFAIYPSTWIGASDLWEIFNAPLQLTLGQSSGATMFVSGSVYAIGECNCGLVPFSS